MSECVCFVILFYFILFLLQGKEVLLDAIGALLKSCQKAISGNDFAIPNAILNVVSSACTKKVKKYRKAALFS